MEDKKINKKVLGIFLGFLVVFFGFLILSNEHTFFFGEEVFLETYPVDPRDLLRGDYVVLSYRIENEEKIQNFINENRLVSGDVFYLVLDKDQENIARLDRVSLDNPKDHLALRATIGRSFSWSDSYSVELGIGKYFVPEGRGREVEEMTRGLHVLVVIDKNGVAKIKNLYYEGEKVDLRPIRR